QEMLRRMRESFEADADDADYVWKTRTLFTASCCPSIVDITFIPTAPHISQILFAKRVQDDEDVSKCRLYCHWFSGCKYLLSVEAASQVFDLSKVSIAQTVEGWDVDYLPLIKRALTYFKNDPDTRGLGLTVMMKNSQRATTIWLKGAPHLAGPMPWTSCCVMTS
ncbi:MAG: hypothetical protein ACRENF_08550, partial [Thermodesulfobacteriota bacterium]